MRWSEVKKIVNAMDELQLTNPAWVLVEPAQYEPKYVAPFVKDIKVVNTDDEYPMIVVEEPGYHVGFS